MADNISGISPELMGMLRQIAEKLSYPEFPAEPVPIKVAAKVLGKEPDTVRNEMELGILNIGYITTSKPTKRGVRGYRRAYISPKLFYELTGYLWRGSKYYEEEKKDERIQKEGKSTEAA